MSKTKVQTERDLLHRKLSHAARRNLVGVARDLLRRGAQVDAKDALGRTALHIAATRGHSKMVDMLLRGGADPSAADGRGMSVLVAAVMHGQFQIAKRLLRTGAGIAQSDTKVHEAVWHVMESGEFELAMRMLVAGAGDSGFREFCKGKAVPAPCLGFLRHLIKHNRPHVTSVPTMRETPWWSRKGRVIAAKKWLGDTMTHAPVSDRSGIAFLVSAIWERDPEYVLDNMPKRARMNEKFDLVKTTQWALMADDRTWMVLVFSQILDCYQNYGKWARISRRGNVRCAPFLLAILRYLDSWNKIEVLRINDWSGESWGWVSERESASHQIVRQLVDCGADVNVKDSHGMSALAWAVTIGEINLVRQLIQWGADIATTDSRGRTPLMFLAHLDVTCTAIYEIYSLLVDAGADVHAVDKFGETVLMWAAREDQSGLVSNLLEAGVDVNAKDKKGRTALVHLREGDQVDPYKVLGAKDTGELLKAAGAR